MKPNEKTTSVSAAEHSAALKKTTIRLHELLKHGLSEASIFVVSHVTNGNNHY